MDREKAAKILQAGLDAGATFVEIFEEETRSSNLMLKDKVVETASAGTEYGVGIRLLYGTEVSYAFTSDENIDSLLRLVAELSFGRSVWRVGTQLYNSASGQVQMAGVLGSNGYLDPRVLGQAYKLEPLRQLDRLARSVSPRIAQVSASMVDAISIIEIINSEGLHVQDQRARCRLSLNVTAGQGSERISAHEAPGFGGGYEVLQRIDLDSLAVRCAERSLRMLDADYIQGGQMPVVMGNGFGGVIFHEACGHPLETESVRRKASPFVGRIGEQIAHTAVTAVDDGTMSGLWGSLNVDDEGTPVQKTVLIQDGILQTFMSDRVGAMEVGVDRSGSARRESYKYAPVSRMRNTYIAAGPHNFDELLQGINEGLFAAKMGGGSVNPATGEFNFAVEEGYRIRAGKIGEPVRGATLIGKGHEILPRISMVANDFETAAGMCGASSGSVPVTVGQPSLKVDRILVGGR